MNRTILALALLMVASCGYIPGSQNDPRAAANVASPAPSPSCVDQQGYPTSCSTPTSTFTCVSGEGVYCVTPAPIEPILGTPATSAPAGNGSGVTAPGPVAPALPTLSITCDLIFTPSDVTLVVAVIDQNSGGYITNAQVTAQLVGTDPQYPTAPATVFSGSSASVDNNYLSGVPTYRFTISPFSVPPPTYDSSGHQTTTPYATYRCRATASWNGASASF